MYPVKPFRTLETPRTGEYGDETTPASEEHRPNPRSHCYTASTPTPSHGEARKRSPKGLKEQETTRRDHLSLQRALQHSGVNRSHWCEATYPVDYKGSGTCGKPLESPNSKSCTPTSTRTSSHKMRLNGHVDWRSCTLLEDGKQQGTSSHLKENTFVEEVAEGSRRRGITPRRSWSSHHTCFMPTNQQFMRPNVGTYRAK